jgi:hypothetical protein
MPACIKPHGIAIDTDSRRLFATCATTSLSLWTRTTAPISRPFQLEASAMAPPSIRSAN